MAEKGFGVKEVNLIGASGTPTITSPNNLNLNAVNVAISTNATVGGTLSVSGNVSVGGTLTYEDVTNIDSVGIVTARDGVVVVGRGVSIAAGGLNVTAGVSTLSGNCSFAGNNVTMNTSGSPSLNAAGTSRFEIASMENGLLDGSIDHTGDTTTKIQFETSVIKLDTAGTTRINVNNSGATVTGTLAATTFSGSGASLTNLPVADSDIQVAYTVTANGTSAYRFAGNGIVSTEDDPDVYLIRGFKYRFINNSGGSHPFQIREASGGSAYSSGVTNNGASSGNIDFQVPYSAPSHLYYQCTSHSGMVGNIYIRGAGGNNTNVGVTTFSDTLEVKGSGGGTLKVTGSSAHTSKLVIASNAGNANGNLLVEGGDGSDFFTIASNGNVAFENGKGIDFSAQTTSSATGVVVQSEKITHFEEGIYVPYVQCSTSGTITLDTSYNKLSYTRINDTVTVYGRIRASAVSSPSGQQLRVGLPFTSDVLTGNGDAGRVFGYARLENAAQHQYYYGISATNGGNNYVQIHRIDENNDSPANVCADVDSNTRISVSFTFRAQ